MNNYLDVDELNNYLGTLNEEIFVIAFYIKKTVSSQDEWMEPLIKFLNARNFTTIGIIASGSEQYCRLDNAEICAVVPDNAVHNLQRINVFIVSDLDFQTNFPQESRVLGFPHGLISVDNQRPWGVMTSQIHNLAALDGWVAPFPISGPVASHIKNLWSNFVNPAYCRRKNPAFQIIPAGYPRLAALSRALEAAPAKADSIVYAPVGNDAYPECGDRLASYSQKILRVLLDSFPTMKIIFRPYKDDLAKPVIKTICDAFAEEDRFSLDSNPGRLKSFSAGAILVTDMSHIAQSFAFTTLRPAIFFQPWRKGKSAVKNWEGGFYTYDFTSLVKEINECLQNGAQIKSMIRKNRDQAVMPPEKAYSDIADSLLSFYKGETKSNWLSIPRNNPKTLKSDMELADIFCRVPPGFIVCAAAAAATYNNQKSPLLCGIALHLGRMALPYKRLYYNLAEIAGNMLGKSFYNPRYTDIDPGDIRLLFRKALSANPKDVKIARIIDTCLASYQKDG